MTEHDTHWRWAAPTVNGAEVPAAAGAAPHGLPKKEAGPSALPPTVTAWDRWKASFADRLPPTLRGRWALDRTTGIVLAVSVLLGALLIGGWAVLRAKPHEMAVSRESPLGYGGGEGAGEARRAVPADSPQVDPLPSVPVSLRSGSGGSVPGGAEPGGSSPAPDASGALIVDVEGKVAKPGVRTLPAGSRILDAINAAGGALPGTDLTSLNQAQLLTDGEQVLVGVTPPPQDEAGTTPGHGKKGRGRAGLGGTAPVHLNTATVDDLQQLPGVGPALAQRVVDYRTQHGAFHAVDELRQVSGFGGQRFATVAPMIAL